MKPWVAQAGHYLAARFGVGTVYGVSGGSVAASDHPIGLALDFMVPGDQARGERLAAYALGHFSELNISYIIWRQRINYGSGWQAMEDRGSITANHFDHVHVSFGATSTVLALTC